MALAEWVICGVRVSMSSVVAWQADYIDVHTRYLERGAMVAHMVGRSALSWAFKRQIRPVIWSPQCSVGGE